MNDYPERRMPNPRRADDVTTVLRVHPALAGRAEPYSTLRELLETLDRSRDGTPGALRARAGGTVGDGRIRSTSSPVAVAAAVESILDQARRTTALTLIVDDVRLADRHSLAVLDRALRRLASERRYLPESGRPISQIGLLRIDALARRERDDGDAALGVTLAFARRRRASVPSRAEQRVLDQLRLGSTNKEIAAALFISVRTVESHVAAIFRKTGVSSRLKLMARSA